MARLLLMVLLCMTFMSNPVQQQSHQSILTSFDEVPTISIHLIVSDASMVLDTVPSLVHKQDCIPLNKTITPPDMDFGIELFVQSPFCFEVFPDSLGFLEVVRSHSNYL
ncbi:hypothetical protein NQ095_03425 [Rossellomorea sp. SC111]|uniref:hypothetical protein n=1 Tax=Rossellomorea sp. SC111 TaxID=2968985 RepID=UPI00215A98D9|nr:hypothetical protein [Rossellomorea sp. SC111]MCR8847444.1 hypothetical protein [Rossellomorea sp. SC111]